MPAKRRDTSVGEPSAAVKDEGQLSFARLAERRGQPEQAQAIYEAFITTHPDNPLPFHRLGVMAARQGDFKKCDEYLSKAFHMDGNNPELLADIGYSMYLRGLTADAETFYRRALELDRDHEAAANNLAMLLVETGRKNEGLAIFKRVNGDAEAYANLGYVLAQSGELNEAKKYFNHALTVDSTLKQAAKGLVQVAEFQKRSRTAPEFQPDRAPEQLAATSPAPSQQQPAVVMTPSTATPRTAAPDTAAPGVATPEFASMVAIKDNERAFIATPRSTPSASTESLASAPAPVTTAEAQPTALPQVAQAELPHQRAQDLSVRTVSKPVPPTNPRLPQVIRPANRNEEVNPPPVFIQQATASTAGRRPPVSVPPMATRNDASPPPVFIQPAPASSAGSRPPVFVPPTATRDDASPPPVFIQPATTWPTAQSVPASEQQARDRVVPTMNPASGVFSTRVSDLPEPMQLPSTQSVPESSMPTTQMRARSGFGENSVRPAALSFEAQQPVQLQSTNTNWVDQPHANLALKNVLPVNQFQPPSPTPQSNSSREFNPFESTGNERK